MGQATYHHLQAGDHAPWFKARSTLNPTFVFDTAAGRYLVLCFFGSAAQAFGRQRLAAALAHGDLFDDLKCSFFGVSVDRLDESTGRVAHRLPGIRHFWDDDWRISRLYGAAPAEAGGESAHLYRPLWVILNPNLQVRAVVPFAQDGSDCELVPRLLGELPAVERYPGTEIHAPVIQIPDVFEPAFCRQLLDAYEQRGGEVSGFMRDVGGKTVGIHDERHKVRRDLLIEDAGLLQQIQQRVVRHVLPAIQRAHQFQVTRMERYLVGCYDAEEGGHFRPHRDNTTRGTAHRRFALSVNLNEDFDGGELVFPEYGPRRYKPAPGSGVVFSGSLLHTVTTVRAGRRFAFLPFLYDDAAAAVRQANAAFLERDGDRLDGPTSAQGGPGPG